MGSTDDSTLALMTSMLMMKSGTEENSKRAKELKDLGNKAWENNKYDTAEKFYSKGLETELQNR